MRLALITIGLMSTVLLAAGCTPEYWVSGLTTPPGSYDVVRSVEKNSRVMVPPGLQVGQPKEVLLVSFNNSKGWDTVAEHIDACMAQAGYSQVESPQQDHVMSSGDRANARSLIRLYDKGGADYAVWLVNIGETIDRAGQSHLPEIQEFTVFVAKLK